MVLFSMYRLKLLTTRKNCGTKNEVLWVIKSKEAQQHLVAVIQPRCSPHLRIMLLTVGRIRTQSLLINETESNMMVEEYRLQ